MKKKASMAGLAGIILVLAVFIILIIYFIKASGTMSGNADRDTCRMSVLGQTTAKDIILSSNLIESNCKTNTLIFYNDHVEINGKTIGVLDERKKDVVKRFNGLTDDIVNQVLAEELRWCWYQFLEGRKSMFEFGDKKDITCFICDEISFDNAVLAKEFSGLLDYMQNNNIKSSNMTYYTYIAENERLCRPKITNNLLTGINIEPFSSAEECWKSVFSDEENLVIKTDNNYFITFIRLGSNSKFSLGMDKIVGTKSVNLETYASFVIGKENLAKSCTVIKRGVVK